jgi:hypothetical protein
MAEDAIDHLAAALFAAARRERATDDARKRVLAAMSSPSDVVSAAVSETAAATLPVPVPAPVPVPVPAVARHRPYRAVFAIAAALAALTAIAVFFRGRSEPVFSIGPERSAHRDELSPAPTLPKVEDETAPEPVVPAPTAEKPAWPRVVQQRPAHDGAAAQRAELPPPASLPDEIASLDRARAALSSGDAQGALRVLDDYDRVLRGTRLTAEATLLRIDALARLGRAAEASALATRFVDANPASALADRARAFIKTSNLSRVDAGGSQ